MLIKKCNFAAAAAVLLGVCVMSEIVCRLSGITDFPVYSQSPAVGYFMVPGQHGVFLHRNHWYVNQAGFNNDREFDGSRSYTLLVGDSVVSGGNPVDYSSRVGTLMEKRTGQNVWVAANGGWSLLNELAYLSEHKDAVRKADHLVIIFDHGDLSGIQKWPGELTAPTRHPELATPYIIRRYLLPHPAELPPIPGARMVTVDPSWPAKLDQLLQTFPKVLVVVLYPDQAAFKDAALWAAETKAIRDYAARSNNRVKLVDLRASPAWNLSLYRDKVHPTVAGNAVIAQVVADQIAEVAPGS